MSKLSVTINGKAYKVEVDLNARAGSLLTVQVDGEPVEVFLPADHGTAGAMDWLVIDGRPYELSFDRDLHWVRTQTGVYPVEIRDLEAVVSRPSSADGRVKAPIPGMITRLLVEEGDTVDVGQPLLILEAMKMENEIRAPRAGTVSSIHVGLNQTVIRNTTLVEIT